MFIHFFYWLFVVPHAAEIDFSHLRVFQNADTLTGSNHRDYSCLEEDHSVSVVYLAKIKNKKKNHYK